ncbi:hypothetical protein DRP07_00215, partial [Archaeoglobales archaeon]
MLFFIFVGVLNPQEVVQGLAQLLFLLRSSFQRILPYRLEEELEEVLELVSVLVRELDLEWE